MRNRLFAKAQRLPCTMGRCDRCQAEFGVDEASLVRRLAALRLEEKAIVAALRVMREKDDDGKMAFAKGDVVKLVGGREYVGRTAVVLGPRGATGEYWYVRLRRRRCDVAAVEVYRKGVNLVLLGEE